MKLEEEIIKPEHLDVLLRFGRQIVLTEKELSEVNPKIIECLLNSEMITKNNGKNCDEPTENELRYVLTDKGEEYCLKYNRIFY